MKSRSFALLALLFLATISTEAADLDDVNLAITYQYRCQDLDLACWIDYAALQQATLAFYLSSPMAAIDSDGRQMGLKSMAEEAKRRPEYAWTRELLEREIERGCFHPSPEMVRCGLVSVLSWFGSLSWGGISMAGPEARPLAHAVLKRENLQ